MLAYLLLFFIIFGAFGRDTDCSVPGPTTKVLRMHMQWIRRAFIVRDSFRDHTVRAH